MIDPARFRLNRKDALLVFIDVQEKLWAVMDKARAAVVQENLRRWIEAAKVLRLPIVWTEQYVKGLGPTIEPLRAIMPPEAKPLEKLAFSCLGDDPRRREGQVTGDRRRHGDPRLRLSDRARLGRAGGAHLRAAGCDHFALGEQPRHGPCRHGPARRHPR